MQFFWGLLLALAAAWIAFRLSILSRSGAAAAAGLGAIVFGLGGWEWSLVLIGFFASSSGLTRFLSRRKQDLNASFSKGGRRDAGQVLANGGLAGLAVLLHFFIPASTAPWLAFCGALAAANADTWATELGVLSRSTPRMITTFKPVIRGTSGGITLAGTLAALAGALFIAGLGLLLWPGRGANIWDDLTPIKLTFEEGLRLVSAIAAAGLAGALVDSLLGATFQAIYFCPQCGRETERHPLHTCGTQTVLSRGVSWLDNDGVNTLCTAVGFGVALLFSII